MLIISGPGLMPAMAQGSGEDIRQIDSMLKDVRKAMDTSTSVAFPLVARIKEKCATLHIDTLTAKALLEEGYCYFYAGNYKKASIAFDSAALFMKGKNPANYAKALNNAGNAYMYNSEYNRALIAFFKALENVDSASNLRLTAQILNNIGLVYESIGDWDNALSFGKRSLSIKRTIPDVVGTANSYGNIGNLFSLKGVYDSAIIYQRMSYQLDSISGQQSGISNALGNIGNAYSKMGRHDSAIIYLQRAIALAKKLGNAENTGNLLNYLADNYLAMKDWPHTRQYALQAAAFVPQITDNEFLQDHYELMYEYYKQTGDAGKAFAYLEKLHAVNDSIFSQKINIQNEKVAIAYEYGQRRLRDSVTFQTRLNTYEEKVRETRLLYIIALLLLLLAVALAMVWYSRSKLLKKQVKELENEKLLLASQAILKGQEDERRRLARDLHDGLGGLMSGIKHSVMDIRDHPDDTSNIFKRPLDMIDTAIKELRRIAQNMTPEALVKFGLEEALRDYCALADSSSARVVFQSFGPAVVLEQDREIIIYRIIQELVNNALKHAGAATIMVQLVKGEGWMTLGVEDNGKGFNVDSLKNSAGAGWGNIGSRVNYLNGKMDVRSSPGAGTSVNIEIKTNHI
ncbi:MAG TPA: tetratricopeptide repeat protein [Puia sp.]|nr:tetratricopeptide repeat protein [Puia sp.]